MLRHTGQVGIYGKLEFSARYPFRKIRSNLRDFIYKSSLAFGRSAFIELLSPLDVVDIGYYFFPARAMPFPVPKPLHRALQYALPFMIAARCRKPQ